MRRFWTVLAAAGLMCFGPGGRTAYADNDDFEKVGDWILYTLPPASLAYAAFREKDAEDYRWDGVRQGAVTMGATIGITQALKAGTNRKRPDFERGDDRDSFPSGHTSTTWSSAAFLRHRYGFWDWERREFTRDAPAVGLAYALAATTAVSRVEAKRHHVEDVVVGVVLAEVIAAATVGRFADNERMPIISVYKQEQAWWIMLDWRF